MGDIASLTKTWAALWLPKPRQSLSNWAESNFHLSSEYSARSGEITLQQFQKGIFDAFTDGAVSEMVVMCSTQMVKTLFIQAAIAHTIENNPSPILLVTPKDDDARAFSKERFSPMLRDNPNLHKLIVSTSRTKQESLLTKEFVGGQFAMVGGIAPGNLARRSIRFLFFDEVDKLPLSAGTEGDPVALAKQRLLTFGSMAKCVLVCSPTTEKGRINQAFEETDQRQFYVPCPACQYFQRLEWKQVEWQKTGTIKERADSAHYTCANCSSRWNDVQRWNAAGRGEWRASKPFTGKAGFTISHLYSPYKKLSALVEDYLQAKHANSMERLKTFRNTSLALPFKESGQAPQETVLYSRREKYPHGDNAIVPKGGLVLVAGVDKQHDRLECEVVAYGRGGESWSIAYERIQAFDVDGKTPFPTTSPKVWEELERRVLNRAYDHELGGKIPITLMAIDSGDSPAPVYEFVRKHPQPDYNQAAGVRIRSTRSVVPTKGTADPLKIISNISSEDAAAKRHGIKIVSIGTVAIKTALFDALQHIEPKIDEPVPNACHFPQYDLEYFRQLCSEERIVNGAGKVSFEKKNNVRNEPLDCRVMSLAAAHMLSLHNYTEEHWGYLESQYKAAGETVPTQAPQRGVRMLQGPRR